MAVPEPVTGTKTGSGPNFWPLSPRRKGDRGGSRYHREKIRKTDRFSYYCEENKEEIFTKSGIGAGGEKEKVTRAEGKQALSD